MTAFRRHLASMGLAVVFCHLVMQVLVPAALCCEQAPQQTRAVARECCPAGSHPGQVCPMHGAKRAAASPSGSRDCSAQPRTNLHDLFTALTTGGVIPSLIRLAVPAGSEAAPAVVQPPQSLVSLVPLGPPPRA